MKRRISNQDLPTKAEDMFCFAVYSATHAINRAYYPLLKPLGLTYPQYIALTMLWQNDGMSVGDLSQRLKMESSTVTPLLKRLENLGHLKRQRSVEDERKILLYLTENGSALEKQALDITACMVESTKLNLHKLDRLVSTLSELTDNLSNENSANK